MAQNKIVIISGIVFLGIILIAWIQFKPVTTPEEAPVETPELPLETVATSTTEVIGTSVEGREIIVESFGTGENDVLFVGGIHGGYEWNSSLLAYEMIDHLHTNLTLVPDNVTVHIIPNLNPDGLFAATGIEGRFSATDIPNKDIHSTGIGRFNANNVDLNRNFDCRWTKESTWRSQAVSGGSAPFSEPEAIALRDYVQKISPDAAIFWHSRANNVYGSECGEVVKEDTLALMSTYAQAAQYGEVPVFDAYVVTGAAEDWLASLGIPTISVELETRDSIEWQRNLAGTLATLELYDTEIVK